MSFKSFGKAGLRGEADLAGSTRDGVLERVPDIVNKTSGLDRILTLLNMSCRELMAWNDPLSDDPDRQQRQQGDGTHACLC